MLMTAIAAYGEFAVNCADHDSLTEAILAIPEDAGKVIFRLEKDVFTESDAALDFPADRGITEIRILPPENVERVSLPGITKICANGIPLEIGEGVILENAAVYGGSCVSEGSAQLETSQVTVSGTVAFVFGGGSAENGAESVVRQPSVIVSRNGSVYYEAVGGGYAYGAGSRVSSETTNLLVEGTVDYVLGCGFAEDGGTSECQQTSVRVSETARVAVALFSGGSAAGAGSRSTVENAKAILEGYANWAFSGDFAYGGGVTKLNGFSRLEILTSGSSEIAYMGSFASDEGSNAYVNTSELMNCGTAETIAKRGQSSDYGETQTLIPALFPCK